MIYFLDAEFNGHGGELISLALVPRDRHRDPFYAVVEFTQPAVPWVETNVLPHLNQAAESREHAARRCAVYLSQTSSDTPTIISNWPQDLSEFANLFMIRPGEMVAVQEYDLLFRRFVGFHRYSATRTDRTVHNALSDAMTLRDYAADMLVVP